MEHLVRFTTAEGRDAQHVAASLDDAVRFVERLRNTEDVSAVKVFRLVQVPISFKTYYKVELRPDADEHADVDDVEAVSPAAGRAVAPPALVPAAGATAEQAEAGDAAGRKLFSRT